MADRDGSRRLRPSATRPGLLLVCAAWLGCAPAAPIRPAANTTPSDTALFAAAVRYLQAGAVGVLLVDPRPLRADSDLSSLDPEDLAPGDSATIRSRERVVRRLGLRGTDALADDRCKFARGLRHPPEIEASMPGADSIRHERERCLARGPFTTVVAGPARLLPPEEQRTSSPARLQITVVRITTSSYSVHDLFLRADEDREWIVEHSGRRMGITS